MRIVVRPGGIISRNGMSLNPVTDTSLGHDSPRSRSAMIAPSARRSFAARIAVVSGDLSKIIIGVKGFTEGDFQGNVLGYSIFPTEYNIADITITDFGDIGEAISGNFSVEYEQLGSTISVSGEFDGLRKN